MEIVAAHRSIETISSSDTSVKMPNRMLTRQPEKAVSRATASQIGSARSAPSIVAPKPSTTAAMPSSERLEVVEDVVDDVLDPDVDRKLEVHGSASPGSGS